MFQPTVSYTSELYPDVSFELKRVGVVFRREIEMNLADNGLRQRLIRLEAQNLNPGDGKPEDLDFDAQKRIVELEFEYENLRMEEGIGWVRMVLHGVKESGQDVAIADFLNYAPKDLFVEVNNKVREHLGFSGQQLGNSQSPTTLPPVVDGATETTSADTAGPTTSTSYETAVSISPI